MPYRNGTQVITHYRRGDSTSPFVEIEESHIVDSDGKIILSEIPNELNKVQVMNENGDRLYEVQRGVLDNNQYKVDYNNRFVDFHKDMVGEYVTCHFFGTGMQYISIDSIYTKQIDGEVVETLYDVFEAVDKALETDGWIKENEDTRIENENKRITQESARKANEAVRIENESERISSEDTRILNENQRIEQESSRELSESTRTSNENQRISQEDFREDNEEERIQSEILRKSNEETREDNEVVREQSHSDMIAATEHANEQGNYAKTEGDKVSSLLETVDIALADVDSATVRANVASDSAEQNAAHALTQGDYAKEQGDYAKAQGDIIEGILEDGTVASVNGKTGAVVLDADDVGAETPSGAQEKADAALNGAKEYMDEHADTPIYQKEAHGMRYVDDSFEVFNGTEWVEIKGGGGGIKLGNVTNLSIEAQIGNKIMILWQDPDDVILEGIKLAKWGGTQLRRKEGTYPINEKDGILVVDNTTKNQYEDGFEDVGLESEKEYFYALFPYTDSDLYTIDSANRAKAIAFEKYTQEPPAPPVVESVGQLKATVSSSSGSVISLNQSDWYGSPHVFEGLIDGVEYTTYAKFEETVEHFESSTIEGVKFTAVDKFPQSPPSAPSIEDLTYDSAKVVSSGATVSLNRSEWYTSPHIFTGLSPETDYTAYAKYPETSTHLESEISIGASFTTKAELQIFGVRIDTTNSNPETAVTYIDDAIGMTPGSSDWDNIYPYSEIRPVLLKNRTVQYELDKSNFTKKLDGSNADITSGNDGDVMIEFPKIWWKFEKAGNNLDVKFAGSQVDSSWKALAHRRGNNETSKVYIGAYLGHTLGGKLRSLSGKVPTVSQTIGMFRNQAQANGSGYEQIGYYQLLMLQVLYLIRYKDRDSQTALGRGYADGNPSATNTGGANTKGMYFGETTGKQQMKFSGIEDFWGNCYYWVDGLFSDASWNILIGTDNYNDTGSGYDSYGQGATANLNGYIGDVQGGTETGFIVKAVGGSSTTHYPDNGFLDAGRLPFFGGFWTTASIAGAFRLRVYYSAADVSSSISARLCCFVL